MSCLNTTRGITIIIQKSHRNRIMAKSENENVYFPHFVSARHDRKIRRLRKELGVEGYGIFFMLLEVLREQSDMRYPMEDIDLLAEELGTSEQKVRVVICNYALFVVDPEEFFFSPKQIEYLKPYLEKSKRAKHAALIRWHGSDANALQMHNKSSANAMQGEERRETIAKERRGTEDHEKKSNSLALVDIPLAERADTIKQLLSTTSLTESQKNMYMLKIESNSYLKPKSNIPITTDTVRADAEFNAQNGWLTPKEQTEYKPTGGYWT